MKSLRYICLVSLFQVALHASNIPAQPNSELDAEAYKQAKMQAMSNTEIPPLDNEENSEVIELDIKKDVKKIKELEKPQEFFRPREDYTQARILGMMKKLNGSLYTKSTQTIDGQSAIKVDLYPIAIENSKANKTTNSPTRKVEKKQILIKGMCEIPYDVLFTNSDLIREFTCRTNKGFSKINITLKVVNEKYEINGIPNFLILDSSKDYKFTEDDTFIKVDKTKSIVTNFDGNSDQLATIVDYKKIEKVLNIAQKEYSTALIDTTKQVVQQEREADKVQTQSSDPNGNVAVTTNTKQPDVATNFVYGLVDGTLRVIDKVADLNQESNPTTYTILAGSKFQITIYGENNE